MLLSPLDPPVVRGGPSTRPYKETIEMDGCGRGGSPRWPPEDVERLSQFGLKERPCSDVCNGMQKY